MNICPCGSFWGPEWDHPADCKLWPGSEWHRDHAAQHDGPSDELQAVALWAFDQGVKWRAVARQGDDRLLSALRELCDSGDATGRLIDPGQLRDLILPYLPADDDAEHHKLPVCVGCGHRHRWGGECADHSWGDSCPYDAGAEREAGR